MDAHNTTRLTVYFLVSLIGDLGYKLNVKLVIVFISIGTQRISKLYPTHYDLLIYI